MGDNSSLLNTHTHAIEKEHVIDWERVELLDKEANSRKRIFSEMFHTNIHNNNRLNKQEDTQFVNPVYKSFSKYLSRSSITTIP